MTAHPCADHLALCDHCYTCEVLRVCCCSLSASQRAQLEAEPHQPFAGLAAAIVQEAGARRSLRELVRAEAEQPSPAALPAPPGRPALPAAPVAAAIPQQSHKEAVHVLAARTTR